MNSDETGQGQRSRKRPENITVNEFLSAISETEYPAYILEAINQVQEWIRDVNDRYQKPSDTDDIFSKLFGFDDQFDDGSTLEGLHQRLSSIEEFADVVPNPKIPGGKADTLIISIAPSDFESGIRTAIDHAAVFNRETCRRVWIISDAFAFDEVIRFVPHVDALSEQGIMLRYILVTPWGWVEMPLSGNMASRQALLWHSKHEHEQHPKPRPRRRKEN